MPRLKIALAYVGTQYCGWQIQEKANPPPTIQGELEKVLRKVTGAPTRVHGAGRTDSGVHAEGQVAHVDVPEDKAHLDWQRIFNTTLPKDISVLSVQKVSDTFHSRFDAVHKTYVYTLWTQRRYMPPRLHPFAWSCGPLDLEAMQTALPYLLGKHDFTCLQNAGTPIEDTVRTLLALQITKADLGLSPDDSPHALHITVTADGFLKQMVRNITGLLVSIGKNKFAVQDISPLLLRGTRKDAPATAPACGLTLHSVHYHQVV